MTIQTSDVVTNGGCVRAVFPNGYELLVLPDLRSVKVGISFVLPGARFETIPYIAHPTEHVMADRDTYPSYEQYAFALDGKTRGFNAEVGKESTVFSFASNPGDLEGVVAFAKQVIIHRTFPERLVREEMQRLVVEEMLDDDTVEMLGDFEDETVFAGHELSRRLFGSREEMLALTVDDIRRWHRRMVRSPIVISVVGNVDPKNVQQLFRRRFGRVRTDGRLAWRPFRSTQHRARLRLVPWPTQLVHIVVATLVTFGLGDRRRIVLSALNNHLGERSRWSSRLQMRFVGKQKLVYGVGSNAWNFRDAGTLTTTTQCEPEHVEIVLKGIAAEYARLRDQRLTTQELELTLKSLVELSEDRSLDPVRYATFLGEQTYIAGEPITHETFVERVAADVSAESIQRLARALIRRERTSIILVGPVHRLKPPRIHRALAEL